jgi:hypothetical protein
LKVISLNPQHHLTSGSWIFFFFFFFFTMGQYLGEHFHEADVKADGLLGETSTESL